jgi:hypothetical protein
MLVYLRITNVERMEEIFDFIILGLQRNSYKGFASNTMHGGCLVHCHPLCFK